jgi:protein O-mannosyl-transferase
MSSGRRKRKQRAPAGSAPPELASGQRTGRPEAGRREAGHPEVARAHATLPVAGIATAWWISLALVTLTSAAFASVWRHEFVSFDDPQYVSENHVVRSGLTWQGLRWALTTGEAGNWHPLTWMSHMLDVQLFGVEAGPHHAVNLALHIANVLLLFGVLWRMTGALWRSGFVAALFALHPAHVESVAWISERKDVLSTFFALGAIWAYVEYVRERRWIWYALVILGLALGLMSKPMVVTLPCVLLLLDYWPLRRPLERRLILEKLPLLALVAASSVATFIAQRRGGAVSGLTALPLASRVGNALVAYLRYIETMLWPAHLTVLYPYSTDFGWRLVASSALLVLVTVLIATKGRSRRYLLVGWLWYLGTLVPVIGLVQVGIQAMADRYTYVPYIGLFIIAAWGIPDLVQRYRFGRILLPASAGVVMAGLAVLTHIQVQYWRDSLTLWRHADRTTPGDAHVETALGSVLAERGEVAEAASLYEDALRREPSFAEAHNKLGVLLADHGRISEAIPHYEAALGLKPALAEAHYNLANAHAAAKDTRRAIAEYREALRLRPTDARTHNGLGSALDDAGRLEEATAEYLAALRLDPTLVDAHINLGAARAKQGRADDAIREFLEAIRLDPGQADAHYNVAVMLIERGRKVEAAEHLRQALRARPDHPGALQAMSVVNAPPPR